MDQWTELADEADRDQAAADAAEGERLRVALEASQPTWVELLGIDPTFTVGHVDCEDCRSLGILLDGTQ